MESAETDISRVDVAREGQDDEASRIMCTVLRQLHAQRASPPPALPPLTKWFEPLGRAAEEQGGILRTAAEIASRLLSAQPDCRRPLALRITHPVLQR
jgi:streptomycin 6-kinase